MNVAVLALAETRMRLPLWQWCACLASVFVIWVAVKELKLSYYTGETLLFTIYSHYGNLN